MKDSRYWTNGTTLLRDAKERDICVLPADLDAGACTLSSHKRTHTSQMEGVFCEYRCLPSFIIIGSPKCGTTELVSWLRRHPKLLAPHEELVYLHRNINEADMDPWSLGRAWRAYAQLFPKCFTAQCPVDQGDAIVMDEKQNATTMKGKKDGLHRLSTLCDAKYMFEKSPQYLAKLSDAGIQTLHRLMPSLKLILILRNPADRVFSHFKMRCISPSELGPHEGEDAEAQWHREHKVKNGASYLVGESRDGRVSVVTQSELGNLTLSERGLHHLECDAATFDRLLLAPDLKHMATRATTGHHDVILAELTSSLYGFHLRRWLQVFPSQQMLILFTYVILCK